MVCTSTASGKSLCYNLPILEALVKDPHATALYMFPTKALAQDQLRALRELCTATFGSKAPSIDIYDGDTPQVRLWIKEDAACEPSVFLHLLLCMCPSFACLRSASIASGAVYTVS